MKKEIVRLAPIVGALALVSTAALAQAAVPDLGAIGAQAQKTIADGQAFLNDLSALWLLLAGLWTALGLSGAASQLAVYKTLPNFLNKWLAGNRGLAANAPTTPPKA
jgi:hypothetical protein